MPYPNVAIVLTRTEDGLEVHVGAAHLTFVVVQPDGAPSQTNGFTYEQTWRLVVPTSDDVICIYAGSSRAYPDGRLCNPYLLIDGVWYQRAGPDAEGIITFGRTYDQDPATLARTARPSLRLLSECSGRNWKLRCTSPIKREKFAIAAAFLLLGDN